MVTSRSRIGFNTAESGVTDKAYWVDLHRRLRSRWVLVIDSPDLCQQAISSGANVIDRRSAMDGRRDEGNVWRDDHDWRTPSKYVEAIIRNSPAKNTVKYVLNEPNVGSAGEMLALSRWLAEVGGLLVARGYRAVLGNFPPANERLDWAEQGAYDPLIKAIGQNKGKLWYGFHAYTWGALPLGVGVTSWTEITPNDLTAMRPEKWATSSQINLHTAWHILRSLLVTNERAVKVLGFAIGAIGTESGWGKMSDIPQSFYQTMEAYYPATAGNNGLDGGEALGNLYRAVYPNWTHAQSLAEQIKWAERLYPANVEGLLIFAYGTFADYGQDYSGNREFHDRLVSAYGVNGTVPPITPPTAPPIIKPIPTTPTIPPKPQRWQSARLSPARTMWVNMRAEARITSKEVRRIFKDTSALVWLDGELPDVNNKAHSWIPVRIGAQMGYIRKDVVNIVLVG